MNLLFRMIWLMIARAIKTPHQDLMDDCTTSFWVNPLDLDLNMHMNNGRYLSIMDLGRLDLIIKSSHFWALAKRGYYPVVTSQSIRFRKSLGLFQSFDLITKIEGWDEKDFYMTQKFVVDGRIYSEGFVKARFLKRGQKGSVATSELLETFGKDYPLEQVTELTKAQREIEKLLAKDTEIQ